MENTFVLISNVGEVCCSSKDNILDIKERWEGYGWKVYMFEFPNHVVASSSNVQKFVDWKIIEEGIQFD